MWREKVIGNRIGEWKGPYTVLIDDATSKIVLFQKDAKAQQERYNAVQVKPFFSPEIASTQFMKTVHTVLNKYSSNPTVHTIYMTEVIDASVPRAKTPEMKEAIMKEVLYLLKHRTFKFLLKEELPDGANALTPRFVVAIKSNADGKIKYKARYVVDGHRDRLKNFMVHGAQTLQSSSKRLLLAMAALLRFDIWSSDIKLAYLQSTEPLTRRVFTANPSPHFELEPNECFELLRPLYGLCDAGDLRHQTMHKHLVEYLELVPTKVDPSLYFSFRLVELVGINGTYVSNLLRTGDNEFSKRCDKTHQTFETSGDDPLPFTFPVSMFQLPTTVH